jgi:4-carboxymuconolactone decarboxylase
MARIPYATADELPDHVRRVLQELPELNVFRMMVHAHSAFPGAIELGAAILGRLELDAAVRELAILQTARCSGSEYEWNQHTDAARAVGVTEPQIHSLSHESITADLFSDRERSALAVAGSLVAAGDIPDDVFEAARACFPPRQLVELILVVGFYQMLGGLVRGLRVELDAPDGRGLIEYSSGRG